MTVPPPGSVVLWVSSRYENIELAQAALDHVCRERKLDGETEHWIGMALREGMANAIKHGNRQDPARRVYVSIGTAEDDLVIVVGDEGEGFEPGEVADPLAPENALKTSGRGIFYMRTFMDEVAFSRGDGGGTVLTMRKNLKSSTS